MLNDTLLNACCSLDDKAVMVVHVMATVDRVKGGTDTELLLTHASQGSVYCKKNVIAAFLVFLGSMRHLTALNSVALHKARNRCAGQGADNVFLVLYQS